MQQTKLPIMTSKRTLVGMLMSGYCYEVTEEDEEEAVAHIGDCIQIFEGSKHSRDQQFSRTGRFWKITNTSNYGIGIEKHQWHTSKPLGRCEGG